MTIKRHTKEWWDEKLGRKNDRSNDLLDGWEVTPSIDSQWDSYFIPIEKDPEGEEAKSKAIDVLEALWDDADSLESMNITVTLKRTKIHKKDYDAEGSDI